MYIEMKGLREAVSDYLPKPAEDDVAAEDDSSYREGYSSTP